MVVDMVVKVIREARRKTMDAAAAVVAIIVVKQVVPAIKVL